MQVRIQSVYDTTALYGLKVLVYGRSGAGKTVLVSTAQNPLYIMAENGQLSLRKIIEERRAQLNNPRYDLPMIAIRNIQDLRNTWQWVSQSREARQFATFGLDSISEIAEQILAEEKKKTKDPRQAYGAVIDETLTIFRNFRDLQGPNVIFIAKEEMVRHGVSGAVRYQPMFPGQGTGPQAPYMFDETFRLFIGKDNEGKDFRALLTQPDFESDAKDRSGRLDPVEYPDMTYIINKAKGLV